MENLKWFISKYPNYVELMKKCSYHYNEYFNLHHLEENVWAHSTLAYSKGIDFNCTNVIKWAKILHDLGRVYTRRINKNKTMVLFDDFEGVSIYASIEILNNTNLSKEEKIRVLRIISYHYDIIDYVKFEEPSINSLIKKFAKDSLLLKDLAKYVKCDLLGRLIDEPKQKYYDKKVIEERTSLLRKVKLLKKEKKKKKKNLYILVGPPCSGKSSWVRSLNKPYYLVCRDNITMTIGEKYGKKTYDEAYDFISDNPKVKDELIDMENMIEKDAKYSKDDIIIDNPNLKIKSRKIWISEFKNTHNIKVILFLTPLHKLLKRDLERKNIGKTIGRKGIINKLKTFEFPLYSEGIDEIEYIM